MLNNDQIGVINIDDLTEEQLKKLEESHKKWVESGCWIPKELYILERYLDEEDSPKFPLDENRFVRLNREVK